MFLRKLELGYDETLMQFMELAENCEVGLVTVGQRIPSLKNALSQWVQ